MIGELMLNWFVDVLICFATIIFIFSIRILLVLSKNVFISSNDLKKNFMNLFNGGEASLLVVSYNLGFIKTAYGLASIKFLQEIVMVIMIGGIVYNTILFVLVNEIKAIENERLITTISFLFLGLSLSSSFLYTLLQAFA